MASKKIELSEMTTKRKAIPEKKKAKVVVKQEKPSIKTKPKVAPKVKPKIKPKVAAKPKLKVKAKVSTKETKKDLPAKLTGKSSKSLQDLKKHKEALIAEADGILERMGDNVFDDNRRYVNQYESMFRQLVTISEMAEEKYFKSKDSRDVYALMKVYDQMRDVIADMKSLQNVGEYIDALVQDVLNPFATTTSQSILDFVNHLTAYMRKHVPSEVQADTIKYCKTQAKASAVKINEAYLASIENTRRILTG